MNKITALVMLLLLAVLAAIQAAELYAQERFGRFFSSPAERKKLDMLRRQHQSEVVAPSHLETSKPDNKVIPEPLTLQGYVKRSDGLTTLWINNKVVQENHADADAEFGPLHQDHGAFKSDIDRFKVRVPGSGKNIYLKPGQGYAPETDRIIEQIIPEAEKQLRLEQTGVVEYEIRQ